MKKLNKVLVLVLSTIMVLAMGASVFAAEVTVTTPDNTPTDAVNKYVIYKVFDATVDATDKTKVSYKLCDGDALSDAMIAAGFSVDAAGNVSGPSGTQLSDAAIAAIAAYVTDGDKIDTKTVTGPGSAEFGDLDPGYYYITTTTGTAVVIKTNADEINIQDKNKVPELDKKAKQAEDPTYMELDEKGKNVIAQLGKIVPFEATINVKEGAEGYVFHDKMSAGLEYQNDVAVTVDGTAVDATNYDKTTASGDTITIAFKDDYIKTVVGKTIVITYSGKVTEEAITVNAETNTATLDYGDKNGSNSLPPVIVKVYNAVFSVKKDQPAEEGEDGAVQGEDGKWYKPLAGAGFVLKSGNAYYKLVNGAVTWVTDIEQADVHTSDAQGNVPVFEGLGNGSYTLVEKVVPAGYNAAADYSFTVKGDDYTAKNLVQSTTVVNNAGVELPGTGGIGTTIFYILGSLLVVGCGIVLISRKRMENNK